MNRTQPLGEDEVKKNRLFYVFLLLLLTSVPWMAGCGGDDAPVNGGGTPARPEPPYDWTDPGLASRLQEALEGWARDFGLYGASAVVTTPGWLDWSGATGVRDRETLEPFDVDEPARIASATKTHTSAVVLQLVDEGLLGLDTTLAEFVPDYPNAEDITVRHLLQHRSGIPDIQIVDGFFILTVLLNPEKWFSPMEILRWTYLPIPILSIHTGEFIPREPVGEPGEKYHYSQPGYIAVGLIIETLTGKALEDVYRERLFEPLGMTGSYLPCKGAPLDPWGYTNLFGLLEEKIPSTDLASSPNGLNSVGWSAGAIISCPRNLVRFLSAFLEGRVCSEAGLAQATEYLAVDPEDPLGEEYGLGLSRQHWDGFTTVGHNGGLPGSGSVMQYIPELDVYVGAVTNTDSDRVEAPELVERVHAALLNQGP
jgi:D-alanyl-D-alanine carboxypeptidase